MPYTPGPWTVKDHDSVIGPAGNVVAQCCGYSDLAEDTAQKAQGGRESNARLIAAAPELLAACQIALTFVQDGELPVDSPKSVASILHAAIAKAKGE